MRINLKRQFNYTARVKIPKQLVKMRMFDMPSAPPRIVVDDFGIGQLSVPHETQGWLGARVVLEANRHTTSSFSRIDAGAVADIVGRAGPVYSGTLEAFDTPENIVFTVKVVCAQSGRLLAEAKNLRIDEEQAQRHELLKVQEHDLGEEPWRLKWEDGIGPLILVNKRLIGDRDNFLTRDAYMQGAILPTVTRMVLMRLLMDPDQQQQPYGKEWLNYAAEYAPSEPPRADDGQLDWMEAERWVDEVTMGFSERFGFTTRINQVIQAPQED